MSRPETSTDVRMRIETDLWSLYEDHGETADDIDQFLGEKIDDIREKENEEEDDESE